MDREKKKELLSKRVPEEEKKIETEDRQDAEALADAQTDDALFDEEEEEAGGRKHGLLFGFLLLAALVGISAFALIYGQTFNSFQVLETHQMDDVSSMEYLSFGDHYIKFSKDGIAYINGKNETVWMDSYAMKMPHAEICGDYILIADLNGTEAYLFNSAGKLTSVNTEDVIVDANVASQGVFLLVLQGEASNMLVSYDKEGKEIARISTTAAGSGYPLDAAMSTDGRKVFISYLLFDGTSFKNQLGAHNFGAVGQNENADRFVGGFELEDTLVAKVAFLGNDNICAFGDNRLIFYAMREKPSQITAVSCRDEIRSIFYNDSYAGTITMKDGSNKNAGYLLHAYNRSGHQVLSVDLDMAYNEVYATDREIILTGDRDCRIYNYRGQLIFSYTFPRHLVSLMPTAKKREYIAVFDGETQLIYLTKSAAAETEQTEEE